MRNRRTRNAIQVEVCEVSGRLYDQSAMIVSDVEGLRGRLVGMDKRYLSRAATAPSYNDYRRDGGDVLPFDDVSRQEPIGGSLELYEVTE
jgi:hypothetical protein